jgi:8-oxo-dGTP diphosphatase
MQVHFYDTADDAALKYAVILARTQGRWVFCRHRKRTTWEIPGGHREPGESIEAAARRELWEETGATNFLLKPVCVYGVRGDDGCETFGMLYAADITAFGELPQLEIAERRITAALPESWTYPLIQPLLLAEALRRGAV